MGPAIFPPYLPALLDPFFCSLIHLDTDGRVTLVGEEYPGLKASLLAAPQDDGSGGGGDGEGDGSTSTTCPRPRTIVEWSQRLQPSRMEWSDRETLSSLGLDGPEA